ncbi:MAG: 50S ribosomal protein L2 [Candidatus Levybacteria bacterium RIFCSPHIGHO2_01_FULL_36_15]|nr:MAG: 50S ribosomal protein L2 [Candidatus Levybacteria bacterium RIFCSPHIGHO2_01_FULL_36_15]OGH38356.1 MAG: 50S ribosomal protein L2 [Candidatus Levybacteria bacterium RIFCSPLOWO2_01_FULL_36_10]
MTRRLKKILQKHSGRNSYGQVTVRHQGGRSKRYYRIIDFKRDKYNIEGKVMGFEYDPNRAAELALIQYADGEKRYIIRPVGLNLNDKIVAGEDVEIKIGNALPLMKIALGTVVHNVELTRGKGAQIARSAGDQAFVTAKEEEYVHIKMPSGEIRKILGKNYATIGQIGNAEWKDRILGKAGASRHLGIRPSVRGVAMNPRSHPHGGGEGRSGIGMSTPKTYTGRHALGKTRKHKKYSDKYIVQKRKK